MELEKINMPQEYGRIFKSIYRNRPLDIKIEGRTSNWHEQQTGIRQGCSLPHHLLLIVMTTFFHDIVDDTQQLRGKRVGMWNIFDDFDYAEVTISTDIKAMKHFLKDINDERAKYLLLLNNDKYEFCPTSANESAVFVDGTRIKTKPEVT